MRRAKGSSWSASAGGRRMLLDLHDNSADNDSSMRNDEYEEPESVFIPNNAPMRTAATATPAASALTAAAPAESAPSGLAGLVSYGSDDDEEDEAPAPTASTAAAAPSSSSSAAAIAPARAPSPPLPAGWTACKDEESGDTYWWNENTDETTWNRPASAAVAVAAADATQTKEAVTMDPSATAVSVSATPSPSPSPSPSPTAPTAAVNAPPGVAKKSLVVADAEMNQGGHDVAVAAAPAATVDAVAAVTEPTVEPLSDDDAGESNGADDDLDGVPLAPAETDTQIYPLPAGWHEVEIAPEDAAGVSNRSSYYFLESTGETTWERPKLSAAEMAQFRAARMEEERFKAMQLRAENEIAAAAARREREERATFLPATAGSCSQALLISALTAGLQARLRPYLSKGMAPFASTSIGDSLSPLLKFNAVLESRIKDWTELCAQTPPPAAAVLEHAESLWVARLTQATVEIDGVLKADEAWRADRVKLLAAQQYESASQQHNQFMAAQMTHMAAYPQPQPQQQQSMQGFVAQPLMPHGYAMQQQMVHTFTQQHPSRLIPPPPPPPAAPIVKPVSLPPVAPPAVAASSGFVHPSRSAHVIVGKPAFTTGVPPPPVNRGTAGQKRPAAAAAASSSAGSSAAAATATEGAPKKKRVDSQDSKQLGRMGGLVSKWTAVAAASERAEQEAVSAGARWKDKMDANNSNLIPIGDWRARVAAGQANQHAADDGSG